MVPAGGGGTFLGGYMVKRWNMRCRDIVRLCVACTAVSLTTIFVFLIHCPNMPMAGVTVPYRSGPTGPGQNQQLLNRSVRTPAEGDRKWLLLRVSPFFLSSSVPPWRRT